ncbi:MAG: 3-dehydroquinate synthase family protein [Alphaproteobacteria bacterium]|nr:3-dehydroquinate synthase family protein [Alphaproteobacteria bacterium]
MQQKFSISSSTGNYDVEVASGLYQQFMAQGQNLIAICDERFAADFEKAGVKAIALRSEETVKSLDAIPAIITQLRKLGTTRDTLLLAVGGGIVQDVSAFCAAIYMRGLDWIYMPTTLLGMADSCIGGKSSINVGEYKNIVGTFNPPRRVLIDPAFTATLNAEQIAAGMIEAAKICYCRGLDSWNAYMATTPSATMGEGGFARVIATSLAAKKWFIETDEFDKGERLLLNFGHTFGHALEGASHYRVSHGIAVGVGMLCALALEERMGANYASQPHVAVMRQHVEELLALVTDLPAALEGVTAPDLFDRFSSDKKHKVDGYRVVVVAADGRAQLKTLPKNDESRTHLTAAMEHVLTSLRKKTNRAAA